MPNSAVGQDLITGVPGGDGNLGLVVAGDAIYNGVHQYLSESGMPSKPADVSRYLARLRATAVAVNAGGPALKNYREVVAGMGFFTVITVTFRILYCLF
jgi:hypothetical protein